PARSKSPPTLPSRLCSFASNTPLLCFYFVFPSRKFAASRLRVRLLPFLLSPPILPSRLCSFFVFPSRKFAASRLRVRLLPFLLSPPTPQHQNHTRSCQVPKTLLSSPPAAPDLACLYTFIPMDQS